jgi:two-component system, cell cycle sensor histidine kinase and response regulator CckA
METTLDASPAGQERLLARIAELEREIAAADRMRASDRLFAAAFRLSPAAITVSEFDGERLVEVNEAFERLTGYRRADSIGRTCVEIGLLVADTLARLLREIEETGSVRDARVPVRRRDGQVRQALLSADLVHVGGMQYVITAAVDITEREVAAEELRASRTKLNAALESMNDGMFITDADGVVVETNAAFARFLRFRSPADCLRRFPDYPGLFDVFFPGGEPAPVEMWAVPRALRGETATNAEYVIRRKDTGETWVGSFSFAPMFGPDGDITGSVVVVRDITEQKRAMEALRASEERFRAVVEQAADALFVHDFSGRLVEVNQQACASLGYNREELLRLNVTDIDADFDLPSAQAHWSRIRPGAPFTLPSRQRRKGGSFFPVEARLGCFDLRGERHILALVRDATEREQAARELREKESRSRLILQTAMDGFWIVDLDGRVLEVNEAYCRLSGFSERELLAMRVWDLEAVESPVDVDARIRSLMATGAARFETWHRRKDGSRYPLEASLQYRPEVPGQIAAFFRDLSERNRAQDELARIQQIVSVAQVSAGFGVFRWDARTGQLYWTPETCRLLGIEATTESTADVWLQCVFPADRERIEREVQRALDAAEGVLEIEYRLLDGQRWIAVLGRVFRDPDGRPDYVVGITLDITRRKAAEEAFQHSEQLWKFALEGSGDGVWDWNAETGHVHYTHQWKAMLGYDDADIGSSVEDWSGRVHPEDRDAVFAALQKHQSGETPSYATEHRLRCKDGSYKWVLDRGKVIARAPDGKPLRAIGTHSDITERKRAEQALLASERRLEDIISSMGDWVWETDEQGVYTYSSKMGFDLFGDDRRGLLGKTPFDLMEPEEAARVGAVFARLVAARAPIRDLENWNIGRNGERICLLTNAVPILDAAGNLKGYRGVDKDITHRKRTEQELARLAAAIEQAAEAIVVTDESATILYVNPAFEKTSGYTAAEALGRNPRILRSGKQDAAFYHEMWATLRRGKVWRGRLYNRRKDGALYQEEMTISPVRDHSGRVNNYIAVKLDVTKEAELQYQLIQSQKMESVGRLAGGVAHDFNNLLTIINGYGRLAFDHLREQDPLKDYLKEVVTAGERAAALTQQLLAFSRKQIMQPRVLDLNRVVGNLHSMLRRMVGEDIDLRFATCPEPLWVHADPHQLEQVIMNLAVNARDAMPRGGRLTLRTALSRWSEAGPAAPPAPLLGRCVLLSVDDTGVGMDEATRQRIFEPFFTTKSDGTGTGLGLSMVQGIVAQSGGSVDVASTLGAGTTFRVFLPALEEPAADTPESAASLPARGGGETILIVEDQAELLTFAAIVLERYGYRVIPAAHALEALAICDRRDVAIDLVLTDVVMPHMGGRELAARLEKTRPGIRVLFMSGYTEDVIVRHGVLHETAPFLSKPFDPETLTRKIREVLHRPA